MTEKDTRTRAYALYLESKQPPALRLAVQLPYRLHVAALTLGRTLDVGCGTGRNLRNLPSGSVGVDHNEFAVDACRERHLEAWTGDEFAAAEPHLGTFDSLLFSHVLEHMAPQGADALVTLYTRYLKPGGRIVLITPQEAGFRSDPTHVFYSDWQHHAQLLARCGYRPQRQYSFPFPRALGRVFRHNEFVTIGIGPLTP